jgi:hypothetical protein
MAIHYEPDEIHEFVFPWEASLPEEDRTVWMHRFADVGLTRSLRKKNTNARGDVDLIGFSVDTVSACLTGWRNYKRTDGIEVAFDKELIKKFRTVWITELMSACTGLPEVQELGN